MLCSLDCLLKTSAGHHETGAWIPRRTYHYVVTKSFPFPTKRKLKILLSFLLPFLSFNDVFLALKFKTLALKTTSLSARGSHFVENGYPSRFVFFYYPTPPKNFQKYAQGHAQVKCSGPSDRSVHHCTLTWDQALCFFLFFLLLCFFGSRGKKMMKDIKG